MARLMALRPLALLWAGAALCATTAAGECATDLDCELNGVCVDHACKCDAAWEGPTCSRLALLPARPDNGLRLQNTTTWGGNVLREDHDNGASTYHLFVAEMVGNCGLTTWRENSRVIRAVSKGDPLGPYTPMEEAVAPWAHNPQVARAKDGTILLFHIGKGDATKQPKACPGPPLGTSVCRPGPLETLDSERETMEHELRLQAAREASATALAQSAANIESGEYPFTFPVHYSSTPQGPWKRVDVPISFDVGPNANPAPLVFENGTVIIIFHTFSMPFAVAESVTDDWRGPFKLRTTRACPDGEDGFLYLDSRGHFHCVDHAQPYNQPTKSIKHSFSLDGYHWNVSNQVAGGSLVDFGEHGEIVFSKRERPKFIFNDRNEITHLITGVTITPECSPRFLYEDGYETRPESCNDLVRQIQLTNQNTCPGGHDRGFTLIQELRQESQQVGQSEVLEQS